MTFRKGDYVEDNEGNRFILNTGSLFSDLINKTTVFKWCRKVDGNIDFIEEDKLHHIYPEQFRKSELTFQELMFKIEQD